MERKDILHQIVETEKRAQAILSEANQRREQLSEYIEEKKTRLRETYEARAAEEIDSAEASEVSAADAGIAELDRNLEAELSKIKKAFEENHEVWAEKLFCLAVGKTDE